MATRRCTFRLYPNKAEEKKLFEARRIHGYLYNACIAHRRYEWRANKRTVSYFEQQNCLPEFKKFWVEFAYLNSLSLQSTVKRVDLAYNAFFQGLRKLPKFKSIRGYSGWTYPSLPEKSGWKLDSNGRHGKLTLRDLGITLKMRGQSKEWGKPSTLTVVYKPGLNQWFASITVELRTYALKRNSVIVSTAQQLSRSWKSHSFVPNLAECVSPGTSRCSIQVWF